MYNNDFISSKLKEFRKAYSYTQDYVAACIGVVRQTYSHYETGKRKPDAEALINIAKLYNISLDEFLQVPVKNDMNGCHEYSSSSRSGDEMAHFVQYFSEPFSKKKYQHNTMLEKELLYYFDKMNNSDGNGPTEYDCR